MPELPEVETVRKLLAHVVRGKRVFRIEVFREKNVETGAAKMIDSLQGKHILDVLRKGKVLGFLFDDDFILTSHLRMEGKYFYQEKPEQNKHDIFRFLFDDGTSLVYNDVRKFGRVGLYRKEELYTRSPFADLGPEPFEATPKQLLQSLQGRKIPIKESLMNQSILAGIGNIYCDETLYACRIHPLTPSCNISLEQCEDILKESCRILQTAIDEVAQRFVPTIQAKISTA